MDKQNIGIIEHHKCRLLKKCDNVKEQKEHHPDIRKRRKVQDKTTTVVGGWPQGCFRGQNNSWQRASEHLSVFSILAS